jgi:hypothetical protein
MCGRVSSSHTGSKEIIMSARRRIAEVVAFKFRLIQVRLLPSHAGNTLNCKSFFGLLDARQAPRPAAIGNGGSRLGQCGSPVENEPVLPRNVHVLSTACLATRLNAASGRPLALEMKNGPALPPGFPRAPGQDHV